MQPRSCGSFVFCQFISSLFYINSINQLLWSLFHINLCFNFYGELLWRLMDCRNLVAIRIYKRKMQKHCCKIPLALSWQRMLARSMASVIAGLWIHEIKAMIIWDRCKLNIFMHYINERHGTGVLYFLLCIYLAFVIRWKDVKGTSKTYIEPYCI